MAAAAVDGGDFYIIHYGSPVGHHSCHVIIVFASRCVRFVVQFSDGIAGLSYCMTSGLCGIIFVLLVAGFIGVAGYRALYRVVCRSVMIARVFGFAFGFIWFVVDDKLGRCIFRRSPLPGNADYVVQYRVAFLEESSFQFGVVGPADKLHFQPVIGRHRHNHTFLRSFQFPLPPREEGFPRVLCARCEVVPSTKNWIVVVVI